jgi:hypothetical protein
MTGIAILVSTASLIQRFCPLMKQYLLLLPFLSYRCSDHYFFISGQNIGTTGMVILVSTASLVDRTSV